MAIYKKMAMLFSVIIMLMAGLLVRIFYLTVNEGLFDVAQTQSLYTVDVGSYRGNIYDINLNPLVNQTSTTKAAIMPSIDSLNTLASELELTEYREFLDRAESGKPFTTEWNYEKIYSSGIDFFEIPKRYSDSGLASHIIGHLDGDGNGAYGIEKVLDDKIKGWGDEISVTYRVNAQGMATNVAIPQINRKSAEKITDGVVLTIDSNIQRIAEEASKPIEKGAVVVLDVQNGDIKASVSRPNFNQSNLAEANKDVNKPFVNRAFSSYNVGSTFKLLVSATALEYQIPTDYIYECVGGIDVADVHFNCHWWLGHGYIDLKKALEISCNPYFINLGRNVGGARLLQMASLMGFGKADVFYGNYKTSTGNLPSDTTLKNPASLANFSFGQGELTATPIQIAKMVCSIANGGKSVCANLIEGIYENGTINRVGYEKIEPIRIMSEQTSAKMREYMVSVVENGSGDTAKPDVGGAGGKTASAQTGRYTDVEHQNEIVHAWFCGFFPSDNPKYAVVVLNENGQSGSETAGPIFKEIADGVNMLEGRFPTATESDERITVIPEAITREEYEELQKEKEEAEQQKQQDE